MSRMTDEQRARWEKTNLLPVELWDESPGMTPLVCPMPTDDELRKLAESVPPNILACGWHIGKPAFGHHYLYAENFRGMGRQWIADLPSGNKNYFGSIAEYIVAAHPRTVLRLLNRIAELEASLAEFQK